MTAFYDTPRAADAIFKVLDEETSKIEPKWRDYNKECWGGKPADIIFSSREANTRSEVIFESQEHRAFYEKYVLNH